MAEHLFSGLGKAENVLNNLGYYVGFRDKVLGTGSWDYRCVQCVVYVVLRIEPRALCILDNQSLYPLGCTASSTLTHWANQRCVQLTHILVCFPKSSTEVV